MSRPTTALFARPLALLAIGSALILGACSAEPTAPRTPTPSGASTRTPDTPPAFDAGATDSVPTISGGYINPNV